MSDIGHEEDEQTRDDLEVKITDLDRDHGRQDDSNIFPVETRFIASHTGLRLSRWSQLTAKQRGLRLVIIVSTVALALLIIVGNIAPIRTTAQRAFFGPIPTPTPALVAGSDFFYIDASPSWGRLLLDGKRMIHPPVMGIDAPIRLSRGRHQLEWSAVPFLPLHCSISVPVAADDTCHSVAAQQNEVGPTYPNVVRNSWVLLLFESMNSLPSAQRIALEQVIQEYLDSLHSTETVYPGEKYVHATANHTIVDTATRPLRATLHFQLATNNASKAACTTDPAACSVQIQGQDCRMICTQPGQFPVGAGFIALKGWFVSAFVSAFWDYATLDGQIIAQNQPATLPDASTTSPFFELQITWESGNWQVNAGFQGSGGDELACSPAIDLMNAEVTNGSNTGYQINISAGSVKAEGCLVGVIPQSDNSANPPSSSAPKAYYLYRFGVLLAVNSLAHHLSPHLPLADAYERKLAQQLISVSQNP